MNEKSKSETAKFDFNSLSSREIQAFLIILANEGEDIPFIKEIIDKKFKHSTRTKGYDYINKLVQKGLVYKKNSTVNSVKSVTVHVKKKIRSEYEKLIILTLSNTKKIVKNLIQENLEMINSIEKNREKIRRYTEDILNSIKDLINETPMHTLKNKRFQKKLDDLIWRLFRIEIVKIELFSK